MKITYKLSILLCLILILSSFKSEETQYFVQLRLDGSITQEQAVIIDDSMRSIDGIMVSRTDIVYSTYFCILDTNVDFSQNNFKEWFNQLGYSFTCFNKGIRLVDTPILSKQLKNCTND